MTETVELEFDVFPGGSRLHATAITLCVTFNYEPGRRASFLYPPLPAEPASIDIVDLWIKSPGPNFSDPDDPELWEAAPSCFDAMVKAILLDEIGGRDG